MSGETSLVRMSIRIGVEARAHREQTKVAREEVLADTINELLDVKEIDLNQLLRLIDKGRL